MVTIMILLYIHKHAHTHSYRCVLACIEKRPMDDKLRLD